LLRRPIGAGAYANAFDADPFCREPTLSRKKLGKEAFAKKPTQRLGKLSDTDAFLAEKAPPAAAKIELAESRSVRLLTR
jgi:hypothetical protein